MEKKMNPAEKLLDGTDVMKLFGVSERTLAQWRKDNVIDFVKIGNVVRYSQGAINEMIKRNDGKLSKTKKWDLQRN
ncbi:MAG: helix-turn-helix domain-containing protein [Marinifilaceae bacterium]|nr:helix-turn-helix domain-containing protein [Marinifilaceae bacterium]